MTTRHLIQLAFILGLATVMLIGCGGPAPQPPAPAQPGTPVDEQSTAVPLLKRTTSKLAKTSRKSSCLNPRTAQA
jgi:hypothetical protein